MWRKSRTDMEDERAPMMRARTHPCVLTTPLPFTVQRLVGSRLRKEVVNDAGFGSRDGGQRQEGTKSQELGGVAGLRVRTQDIPENSVERLSTTKLAIASPRVVLEWPGRQPHFGERGPGPWHCGKRYSRSESSRAKKSKRHFGTRRSRLLLLRMMMYDIRSIRLLENHSRSPICEEFTHLTDCFIIILLEWFGL